MGRQTQHRPRRDERNARERADLKRERDYLARQNRRLEGELEKARAKPAGWQPTPRERPLNPKRPGGTGAVRPAPAEPTVTGLKCWMCPCDDVRVVDLGEHGEFLVCPFCKARRKRPTPSPRCS